MKTKNTALATALQDYQARKAALALAEAEYAKHPMPELPKGWSVLQDADLIRHWENKARHLEAHANLVDAKDEFEASSVRLVPELLAEGVRVGDADAVAADRGRIASDVRSLLAEAEQLDRRALEAAAPFLQQAREAAEPFEAQAAEARASAVGRIDRGLEAVERLTAARQTDDLPPPQRLPVGSEKRPERIAEVLEQAKDPSPPEVDWRVAHRLRHEAEELRASAEEKRAKLEETRRYRGGPSWEEQRRADAEQDARSWKEKVASDDAKRKALADASRAREQEGGR
jgi:hypothetical protein